MVEFPIVGIGSSVGGVEALQKLLGAMPPDGGLGFVVAAHLDPTQESHLTGMLAQCTSMPVIQIECATKIEPDHVYVIAPDQKLSIKDGVVQPDKPLAPRGHWHPVDSFFRSLAEDQGERAIAIILSGNGSNGSLGLRFIKAEDGIVIAQDPTTATFPEMPRSAIGTGIVDLILPPEEMPAALVGMARNRCPFASGFPTPASIHDGEVRRELQSNQDELLLRILGDRYAPPSVLIDHRCVVHYFHGQTGEYLRPASGEPSHDLLSMAREGLQMPLSKAVSKALAEDREITADACIRRGRSMQPVRVVVSPIAGQGASKRLLVGFFNRSGPEDATLCAPPDGLLSEGQLTVQPRPYNEHLDLTIEQMEVAYQELRASNEAIYLVNDELRSYQEELKSSKEEIQALNAGLRRSNNELLAIIADLEERTNDLDNLVSCSDIAMLFLDRMLCIRWFTPAMKDLFALVPSDLGRPISHFAQRFTGSDLLEDVKKVLAELSPKDAEVLSDCGRWYIRRALAYRTDDGRVLGVAIAFTDITERKRAEDALFDEKERAQITLHSIGDAVITTTERAIVDYLNPAAEALTGWPLQEAIGQPLDAIFQVVDERTGKPMDNLVSRCLNQDRIVEVSDHAVLVGRTGRETAIQDSAAPIRNRLGLIVGAVLVFHDVTEVRKVARRAAHQASHDPLTGLLNRRAFEERLEQSLVSATTQGAHHALCFIDLDGFKLVNDTMGHAAGDELLNRIASLLARNCRSRDTLARIGGDEFCLLMEHCSLDDAAGVAAGVIAAVRSQRFHWEDRVFSVGSSIGITAIDKSTVSVRQSLADADGACYVAKSRGGNLVHVRKSGPTSHHANPLVQAADLHRAIAHDHFLLLWQKIKPVNTRNKPANMYEVLLRLVDASGVLVLPQAFIPVAERYGMMPAIDRWVIRETFRQATALVNQDNRNIISINLSGQTFSDESLLDFILTHSDNAELPADCLCLEITETAAINNFSQAAELINNLRQRGCRFALDDFGKGVSSLAYLKNLSVDFLKIDGSFVLNLADSATDRAMVSAMNELAHALGIETIAECAETAEVVEALTELGVDYVQGIAIGEPSPIEVISNVSTASSSGATILGE